MSISKADYQTVMERGHWRCEYCLTQKRIVITIHIDHIIPKSKGGSDDVENLCCVCIHCNQHKAAALEVYDKQREQMIPLFNPRIHHWSDHFIWSADSLQVIGITAIGEVTVERLQMNHSDVVMARGNWVIVGWHPPQD